MMLHITEHKQRLTPSASQPPTATAGGYQVLMVRLSIRESDGRGGL
ncbi:MAG: hypothetical protein SNJ58_06305 [Aggregatilineales bacterium]